MYWPTGSASRLSSTTSRPEEELIGIEACPPTPQAPIGLFATWTTTELSVWNPKPRIVITKLVRSQDSLSRLGKNRLVKWKPDKAEHLLVIWTVKSALIIYRLEALPDSSVYTLPPDHSTSFLLTGPADRIPFPTLALKLVGEMPRVDNTEEISCLALTPTHILIGISSPAPQLRTISWSSILLSFVSSDSHPHPHHNQQQIQHLNSIPSVKFSPKKTLLAKFDWFIDKSVTLLSITYSSDLNVYIFVTSDGRAYVAHLSCMRRTPQPAARPATPTRVVENEEEGWMGSCFHEPVERLAHLPATGACAINFRFSLVAIGVQKGIVDVYNLKGSAFLTNYSHSVDLSASQQSTGQREESGEAVVNACAWTSDGHALAVAASNGFSVWSVYGRLQTSAITPEPNSHETKFEDYFMGSCRSLFWGPGNFELFLLTPPTPSSTRYIADDQLFVLPFAQSAVATLHSPDNTKQGFLQLEDRVSVYRGSECADLSVINPSSEVWQHIKIPADYISTNWPIECGCISEDGKLLAVAGKRGFTHFNSVSGRWKLFSSQDEEQAIHVRGGMQWFLNILLVGIDEGGSYSIRMFARENTLSLSNCLFEHPLQHPIVLLSRYDTSLLIYTSDNTLTHMIIKDEALIECGRIGLEGVVGSPLLVRGISWLLPDVQHCFGEPEKDLDHATIILLIGGNLVVLRPQRTELLAQVKYHLQVLADRVEFYWAGIHLDNILLDNSLWAWDSSQVSVWLDALSIGIFESSHRGVEKRPLDFPVQSKLTIPLNFHPLSVLMDKGIFVGIQQETVVKKSLSFALFRIITSTELFIYQVIKFYLIRGKMDEAVEFGAYYSKLIYFSHSLEMLLHTVLEEEEEGGGNFKIDHDGQAYSKETTDASSSTTEETERKGLLPMVAEFLDYFKESLEVVVGCARKIDIKQWKKLFSIVGKPRDLFEKSLSLGLLHVASSYLLILNHYYLDDESSFFHHHNPSPIPNHHSLQDLKLDHDPHAHHAPAQMPSQSPSPLMPDQDHYSIEIIYADTVRLFKIGIQVKNWTLCKEVMRFLFSLDHSGRLLKKALHESGLSGDD